MTEDSSTLTSQIKEAVSNGMSTTKNGVSGLYTVPAIINGKDVQFSSTFPVHAPATGKHLHDCTSASAVDAISAVDAAEEAFKSWRNSKPRERRRLFLKAADVLESHAEEYGKYAVEETGAKEFWGSAFNIPLAADILRDIAGRVTTIEGSVPTCADEGTSAIVFKEPFGVILGIAPWNAPYILGFRSIAYAIAAGNTAVLKGPEFSPRCFYAIGSVFREAGFPPGVLNFISHKPSDAAEVTKALIEDFRIKKVNFTGSTAVGRIIASLCGQNLKPCLMELGGKAPAIVWEDADLKLAAKSCAMGAFLHSGQICMSTEKVIVHKNVAAEFELQFQAAIKEGWNDAATLINKGGVEKNKRLLKDAVSKGARLLNGDLEAVEDQPTKMKPIVVADVKENMDLFATESFGPTVSMMVVESEEEALKIANNTEYGLSSAVFTEDLRRGLRFAKGIETGAVHINDMSVHDETALPHGGAKASGFGRFGSIGLDEWVRTKTVTYKN